MIVLGSEADQCRRIAFIVASAETSLGLNQTALPLNDRLHAVLSEAAMRPGILDASGYELCYRLHQGAN